MEVNKIEKTFGCLENNCDKMVDKINKNKEDIQVNSKKDNKNFQSLKK